MCELFLQQAGGTDCQAPGLPPGISRGLVSVERQRSSSAACPSRELPAQVYAEAERLAREGQLQSHTFTSGAETALWIGALAGRKLQKSGQTPL
jgi:hypothetical protein